MPVSGPRAASIDAGGDVTGNDRVRHAGQTAVPEVHVGAADLGALTCAAAPAPGGKIGTRKLAQLDRLPRRGHHRGENAVTHAVYVILERMLIQTVSALWLVAALAAPDRRRRRSRTSRQKARRHFISVTLETAVRAAVRVRASIRWRNCSGSR